MKKITSIIIAFSVILFCVTFSFAGPVEMANKTASVGGGPTNWLTGVTPTSWEVPLSSAGTFRILWVSVKFSMTGTTESFVFEINNSKGAGYDTIIKSVDMAGSTDYFWIPDQELIIGPQSGVSFYCTGNGGIPNTVNVSIQYESGVR